MSVEYTKKIVPIVTQCYPSGAHMDKYVNDITKTIRQKKNKKKLRLKLDFSMLNLNIKTLIIYTSLFVLPVTKPKFLVTCWVMSTSKTQLKECTTFFGKPIHYSLNMFLWLDTVVVFIHTLNTMIEIWKYFKFYHGPTRTVLKSKMVMYC